MSLVGGLRELLRPPPHRGPLVAAGAVALAVGLALEVLRLRDRLPVGVHAALLLCAGALVFWLGAQAPNEDGVPPAYQSVLLATGLPLLFAGLLAATAGLGGSLDPPPVWALMVTCAAIALVALWPALERNSAISLLIAAALATAALQFAWSWVFGTSSPEPYRWLAFVCAGALVLASLTLREPARRHAEVLVDAGGLAIAWIGVTSLVATPFGALGLPVFWELVLLAAGFGLVAFGALDRSPGPAYLGVVNLVLFIAAAAASPDRTLFWWPLLLLAAGVAMLAAGLRPRRPLPPEPPPYRAGEAPLAARADDREAVVRVRDES
jgi:hypothetical protein